MSPAPVDMVPRVTLPAILAIAVACFARPSDCNANNGLLLERVEVDVATGFELLGAAGLQNRARRRRGQAEAGGDAGDEIRVRAGDVQELIVDDRVFPDVLEQARGHVGQRVEARGVAEPGTPIESGLKLR